MSEEFSTWSEDRQEKWNKVPFDANAYYMEYLPPGVFPHGKDWSANEDAALLEAVCVCAFEICINMQNYPPQEKWGLFSFHMLGRTGADVIMI
jgi:hypothetical protein